MDPTRFMYTSVTPTSSIGLDVCAVALLVCNKLMSCEHRDEYTQLFFLPCCQCLNVTKKERHSDLVIIGFYLVSEQLSDLTLYAEIKLTVSLICQKG